MGACHGTVQPCYDIKMLFASLLLSLFVGRLVGCDFSVLFSLLEKKEKEIACTLNQA